MYLLWVCAWLSFKPLEMTLVLVKCGTVNFPQGAFEVRSFVWRGVSSAGRELLNTTKLHKAHIDWQEREDKKRKQRCRRIDRIPQQRHESAAGGKKRLAFVTAGSQFIPLREMGFVGLFQYLTNVLLIFEFRSSPACVLLSQTTRCAKLCHFLRLSFLQSAERSCLLQIGSQNIFQHNALSEIQPVFFFQIGYVWSSVCAWIHYYFLSLRIQLENNDKCLCFTWLT